MTKLNIDEAKRLAEEIIKIGGEPKVLDICEALLHQSQELERLRECVREAASIIGSHCMEAPIGDYDTDSYCLGSSEECKEWLTKYSDLIEVKNDALEK